MRFLLCLALAACSSPLKAQVALNSYTGRYEIAPHNAVPQLNRDPLIISWPRRISGVGEFRSQYHHVVDIVPTLLEITGLPAPASVNGIKQMPLHGVSMANTFGDADAPTRRKMQYYEMLGSRAI
jgi:arylsulfatase